MQGAVKPNGHGLRSILAAGLFYFALIFLAGTLLGIVRTLCLAPRVGAVAAVACEIPVMLCIVWMSSAATVRVFRIPASSGLRFTVGAIAFILLQLAEMALAWFVFGLDAWEYWRAAVSLPGALGLAAQLFVPWAPVLHRRSLPAGDLAQIKPHPGKFSDDARNRRST